MPRLDQRLADLWLSRYRLRAATPTLFATAAMTILGLLIVLAPQHRASPVMATVSPSRDVARPALPSATVWLNRPAGSWVPTESEWGQQLSSPSYWADRRSKSNSASTSSASERSGLTSATAPWSWPRSDHLSMPMRPQRGFDSDDATAGDEGSGKTYRTMCVRLCDGYYWPINYAVTKDKFADDASTCARTCGGPGDAKLFSYRNPGGEIDDMEDSDGRAYKKLQTAFLFKTKYEPSCKCRAHPWEETSADRHKAYALVQQAQKGNKAASVELKELRIKLQGVAKAAAKQKAADAKAAAKNKSASVSPVKSAASAADTPPSTAPTPTSPAAALIPRGAPRRTGYFKSVPATRAALASEPASAPLPPWAATAATASVVILRYGATPPREVQVRSTWRASRSELTDGQPLRR